MDVLNDIFIIHLDTNLDLGAMYYSCVSRSVGSSRALTFIDARNVVANIFSRNCNVS